MHAEDTAPLDLDDALELVLSQVPAPERYESIPIAEALGRVAAQPILSATDLPPFPASAMDGYAYRWQAGLDTLVVGGASLAGHPFVGRVGPGQCVRITTGAPLPPDCDTVIVQEDCELAGDRIRIVQAAGQGDNVRARGNDLRGGDVIVEPGKRLSPFDIGTLAACGRATARVWTRPRIAIFSTGDELQAPGTALAFGNIYDSNRYAVQALLATLPIEVANLGVLADDAGSVAAALGQASADCQMLLTSGGVSVGDADLVKSTVEALGEVTFWRMNIKPGKPLAFGRIGASLFVGLPGNPVSTIVTFLMIARPAIERLCGMQPQPPVSLGAQLTEAIAHKPGREEFQRGIASYGGGKVRVRTTGNQGSNRMSTFAAANCLIRIPKRSGNLAAGQQVTVLPFAGLI